MVTLGSGLLLKKTNVNVFWGFKALVNIKPVDFLMFSIMQIIH